MNWREPGWKLEMLGPRVNWPFSSPSLAQWVPGCGRVLSQIPLKKATSPLGFQAADSLPRLSPAAGELRPQIPT